MYVEMLSRHTKGTCLQVNGTISQMSNCQLDIHETQEFCSTQVFQDGTPGSKPSDPVGRPLMHLSGRKHTTGEAIYTDDIVYSGTHLTT